MKKLLVVAAVSFVLGGLHVENILKKDFVKVLEDVEREHADDLARMEKAWQSDIHTFNNVVND